MSVSCFHELLKISMLTNLSSMFWAFWLVYGLLCVTTHSLHISYLSLNSTDSRDRMQFLSCLNFWFSFSLVLYCLLLVIWFMSNMSIYKLFLRRSPEFIIPYNQYVESAKNNYSIGMKVRMKFEGDEGQEERWLLIIARHDEYFFFFPVFPMNRRDSQFFTCITICLYFCWSRIFAIQIYRYNNQYRRCRSINLAWIRVEVFQGEKNYVCFLLWL